jgi:PAS domain S-box-containing protein
MNEGWGLITISPLLFSAILGVGLAVYILQNRRTPSALSLLALTAAVSLWCFGYAMELLLPAIETKQFWTKVVYVGVVFAPLAWAIFALRFFGAPSWTNLVSYRMLLALVPGITLALAFTNEQHSLLWRELFLQPVGPLFTLGVRYGPWFYVHMVYSYGLLLWGSIRLVGGLFSSTRLYRWQIALTLLAVGVPWLSNVIYISRLNPVPYLDWTPFAFTISGLLLTTSLFRFQLIEILPIAQKTVFSGLPDCHMVLDGQDCLVDFNQAAEQVLGRPSEELYGKPLVELVPEVQPLLVDAGYDKEYWAELTLGMQPNQKHYEVRIAALSDSYPLTVGRLVVCHEITQLKQEQERLEQAVAERTEELQKAVVQLQNELAERTLAERRFQQIVESAPDAMVLTDRDGVIQLINAQTEQLLGYQRQELLGQNYELLISEEYQPAIETVVEDLSGDVGSPQRSSQLNISARHKDGRILPLEISLGRLETASAFWVTCNLRDISERVEHEQAQARLLEQVRRSSQQLGDLAIRLEEVQEAEQRRIALELHDRVGQSLTGLNLNLQAIQSMVPPGQTGAIKRLEDSLLLVEETTRQVRGLMAELDPPLLQEYGLLAALRFAGQKFSERTGLLMWINGRDDLPRFPHRTEKTLFRIAQECLNNVVKHAQATRVQITFTGDDQKVVLSVEDDGVGFDPQQPFMEGQPSWGLVAIRERVNSICGELLIDSAPGQGACIQIELGIDRGE